MTRYRKISATIIAAISFSLAAMAAPAVAAGPYYGGLSLGSSEL
ncbi:MAG: hypothetical protein WCB36_03940 [Burkholderiales bacterium]